MLPPTPHNIILFKLDLNVKFPLLRLLQFLSDLKSTIVGIFYSHTLPIGRKRLTSKTIFE